MIIRREIKDDIESISHVEKSAFETDMEARLVKALRSDSDLCISLVALEDNKVVGHIALSPMTAPVRTLGLGPVAVLPERQNNGIGSALISESLKIAAGDGWQAVFLLGHADYYPRFGFCPELAANFQSPYASPNFMALELVPGCLDGKSGLVDYAPAFSAL